MVALVAGNRKILSDPQVRKTLLRALKYGATNDMACDVAEVSRSTFYNLLKRVADGKGEEWEIDLVDACKRATSRGNFTLLRRIRIASKEPREWKAAMALLERRMPDAFGPASRTPSAPSETKNREQMLAEVRAELDAMDASVPSQPDNTKGPQA